MVYSTKSSGKNAYQWIYEVLFMLTRWIYEVLLIHLSIRSQILWIGTYIHLYAQTLPSAVSTLFGGIQTHRGLTNFEYCLLLSPGLISPKMMLLYNLDNRCMPAWKVSCSISFWSSVGTFEVKDCNKIQIPVLICAVTISSYKRESSFGGMMNYRFSTIQLSLPWEML